MVAQLNPMKVSTAPPPPAAEGAAAPALVPCSMRELLLYFLRLGTFGFGGPIALAGYMQRDLVERRRWISKQDYVEGLALAQLAPGPLAAQLAIYLGWVRARIAGATLVSLAFISPSLAMVLAISALYVRYGGLSWMQGVFYGIGAAVIAIIARSAVKLVRLTLERDKLLWSVFAVSAAVTGYTEKEILWIFLAGGLLVMLVRTPLRAGASGAMLAALPHWVLGGLGGPASAPLVFKIFWFFAEAGAVVFGSGLAIVPFLHGGVVNELRWLDERQFLDAVAVAMITPGPVVITVGFIGYLVAGLTGALVAALATFLPCYLFTILPAPYFKKYGKRPALVAFVDGVTAAAIGAIMGAVIVLAKRSIIDITTSAIAIATVVLIWKLKKLPEPLIVALAAIVGLVAFPILHR